MTSGPRDRWAEWVLARRFGGDRAQARQASIQLAPVRDRVLGGARLGPGETLLDVGAGDGLIAFGALDRLGSAGVVIFVDISQDLLDHSQRLAEELGVEERCRFVLASADALDPIGDESVDAVTTRSVLIYLDRGAKERAFREFHRVLRPGGRGSFFEPINGFGSPEPRGWFCGYDLTEVASLVEKVEAAYSPAAENTLVDFDERDLLTWAAAAGFEPVRLDYEAEIGAKSWLSGPWETVLESAPNPLAPTLDEALEAALTEDERETFETRLRALVEANAGRQRSAGAYLSATKPN